MKLFLLNEVLICRPASLEKTFVEWFCRELVGCEGLMEVEGELKGARRIFGFF
jgi:hypothetical protein